MSKMIDKQNQRVLVLGGSGMIGRSINRLSKKHGWKEWKYIGTREIDLTKESSVEKLRNYVQDARITHTIILAARKRQISDDKETRKHNDMITINTTRALSESNTFNIYMSSCAVYGEKNEQVNYVETSTLNPTSNYGDHKAKSEEIYMKAFRKENLMIIRAPMIYSISDNGYNPSGFLKMSMESGEIELWGDGKELREFITVEDAATCICKLLQTNTSGKVNLTSSKSYTYYEIAMYLRNITGCKVTNKLRSGVKVNHTYDNTELKKRIGNIEFTNPFQFIGKHI